jgi:hypothetical protein
VAVKMARATDPRQNQAAMIGGAYLCGHERRYHVMSPEFVSALVLRMYLGITPVRECHGLATEMAMQST